MKLAQISVDFMMMFVVAMIMFMFLFTIAIDKSKQFSIESSKLYAKEIADKIAQEINGIYITGNGASDRVNLPRTMYNNIEYSINIYPSNRLVEINYTSHGQRNSYSSVLLISQVHTNLTNFAEPITITNNNGEIIVS